MRSLFLTFLLLAMPLSEAAGAHLSRISQSSSAASMQVFAHFDTPPLFRERVSERRLDLIFQNSSSAEKLPTPEANEAIVKTLVVQDQNDIILSLFFRYTPQDYSITSDPSGLVIIDLIAGNKFTETYRDLNTRLGFLSPVSRSQETFVSPLTFVPYREDWRMFFAEYTSPSDLEPLPQPHIPPFPLTSLLFSDTAAELHSTLTTIAGLAVMDRFEALRQIQKQLNTVKNDEEQKYFALAHADILFRLGSVDAARTQFNIVAETYGNERAGSLARYATGLIEAHKENHHLAQARLSPLLDRLPASDPLRAYVNFALAESLLATGNIEKMGQLLESDNFPAALAPPLTLRRADLAFANGRFEEAFTTYEAFSGSDLLRAHRYSANGYCAILLMRQENDRAQRCYLDLAEQLNTAEEAAQSLYLAALAGQGKTSAHGTELQEQVLERYPHTQAALRAEIKLADSCVLSERNCQQPLSNLYRSIADRASDRSIAEEASFKEALIHHLENAPSTAVRLAQQMLRTFQSGNLGNHAMALIIQLLPAELQGLLEAQRDIEAIALAQQNRGLFEKGWLDGDLLFRLSLAYERLRMYPEALQLLLYVKNNSDTPISEEVHFATLRSAHALGAHYQVEDLAAEYSYRFPQGRHTLDVLFFRMSCKYGAGRINEALSLLPDPIPQRRDFRLLAAALDFHRNNFRQTADLLLPLYQPTQQPLPVDHLYMLAESLFELGETSQSYELFSHLVTTDEYRPIARHRLMLLSDAPKMYQATDQNSSTFPDLTDSDPWHRFAAQDRRFMELISNL